MKGTWQTGQVAFQWLSVNSSAETIRASLLGQAPVSSAAARYAGSWIWQAAGRERQAVAMPSGRHPGTSRCVRDTIIVHLFLFEQVTRELGETCPAHRFYTHAGGASPILRDKPLIATVERHQVLFGTSPCLGNTPLLTGRPLEACTAVLTFLTALRPAGAPACWL